MLSSMCFNNWNTFTKVGYVGESNIASYTQCLSSLLKIPCQNWITYNVTSCVIVMNFFSYTYVFHKLSCSLHKNFCKHCTFCIRTSKIQAHYCLMLWTTIIINTSKPCIKSASLGYSPSWYK
jgi:hypothetical protein